MCVTQRTLEYKLERFCYINNLDNRNCCFRLICMLLLVNNLIASEGVIREKRQLMYPPNSIMQLAFAVVTPAQVSKRTITTNMGIMFNTNLPTNTTKWYPWRKDYRRRRDADPNSAFYHLLQTLLTMNGFDGRACLEKSICQMKETPLHSNDIPHQILNIIFGYDQKHTTEIWNSKYFNTSCEHSYPTCQHSPVDIFIELITASWTSAS